MKEKSLFAAEPAIAMVEPPKAWAGVCLVPRLFAGDVGDEGGDDLADKVEGNAHGDAQEAGKTLDRKLHKSARKKRAGGV